MAFMPRPKQQDTSLKQVYSKKKPAKQQSMDAEEMGEPKQSPKQELSEEAAEENPALHKVLRKRK